MTPRVLVMGRKPGIVEAVHEKFGAQPVTWAEAGTEADILQALQDYPDIRLAAMGAGLDDDTRGRPIAVIAAARPDVTIHLEDRASGPGGMAEFVVKLISTFLTNEAAA